MFRIYNARESRWSLGGVSVESRWGSLDGESRGVNTKRVKVNYRHSLNYMITTTYYGETLKDKSFNSRIDPIMWNTVDGLVKTDHLEPYIQISDIDMHFYPERMQCIQKGKVFSVIQTENTLKFKHQSDKEIKHEVFSCREKFLAQWRISRKICNTFDNAQLFLDCIENLDSGCVFYQIITKGHSFDLESLLKEVFNRGGNPVGEANYLTT